MNFKNLASNYFSAFMAVAAPLLALPVILNIIGIRMWGLVSIMMVLQMLVGLLDAGLSQVMTREIADQYNKKGEQTNAFRDFYFSYFNLYVIISLFLLIVGCLLSETLVSLIISVPEDLMYEAKLTGYSAFFVSSVQLASSMPRSLLAASERHTDLAIGATTSVLFRTLISCIVLNITQSYEYLLVCYCAGAALEAALKWYFAKSVLNEKHVYKILRSAVAKHSRVAAFLTVSVGISLMSGQLDKIYVAHFLRLEDLAVYNIASTISMGALHAYYPLMLTISPSFYSKKDADGLRSICFKTIFLLVKLMGLAWLIYILLGEYAIYFWLRNEELAKKVFSLATILLCGVSINSIYNVFYTILISGRAVKYIFIINFASLVLIVIASPYLVNSFGLEGAAFSWAGMQLFMLIIGSAYSWSLINGKCRNN